MKCLYCDKRKKKRNLMEFLYGDDLLCSGCRNRISKRHRYVSIGSIKVEVFYVYDSLFKNLLIQYKECLDEALKDVFLYEIKEYLKIKYHGYRILYVPSCPTNLKARGFNPVEEIFKQLGLKSVEGLSIKEDLSQKNKDHDARKRALDNYVYSGKNYDKVLVVDDVLTSGSTLNGINKVIRPHFKTIKYLALAN